MAAPLPYIQTSDDGMNQVQNTWMTIINPVLSSPLATPVILRNVKLVAGTNTISHTLGRRLQGWYVVRQRGPSTPTRTETDWTSYTPTGSWSANTTYTGLWRRVGDSMEVQVKVATSGAPTTATLTVNLPAGYTIDTTKLSVAAIEEPLGQAAINDSSTTYYKVEPVYESTTAVRLRNLGSVAAGIIYGNVSQANPITFGAGDSVVAWFRVPITGWAVTDSSFAQVYDTQDSNPLPDKTLLLTSSAAATVDLLVF